MVVTWGCRVQYSDSRVRVQAGCLIGTVVVTNRPICAHSVDDFLPALLCFFSAVVSNACYYTLLCLLALM